MGQHGPSKYSQFGRIPLLSIMSNQWKEKSLIMCP